MLLIRYQSPPGGGGSAPDAHDQVAQLIGLGRVQVNSDESDGYLPVDDIGLALDTGLQGVDGAGHDLMEILADVMHAWQMGIVEADDLEIFAGGEAELYRCVIGYLSDFGIGGENPSEAREMSEMLGNNWMNTFDPLLIAFPEKSGVIDEAFIDGCYRARSVFVDLAESPITVNDRAIVKWKM